MGDMLREFMGYLVQDPDTQEMVLTGLVSLCAAWLASKCGMGFYRFSRSLHHGLSGYLAPQPSRIGADIILALDEPTAYLDPETHEIRTRPCTVIPCRERCKPSVMVKVKNRPIDHHLSSKDKYLIRTKYDEVRQKILDKHDAEAKNGILHDLRECGLITEVPSENGKSVPFAHQPTVRKVPDPKKGS